MITIYKGIETWIVLIPEDNRDRAAIALNKAGITFVAAKGGNSNGVRLTLLEIGLSESSEEEIRRALQKLGLPIP